MRNLYLVILASILLESCSFTQRRYLPGFSVEWNHRAPKTIVNKNKAIARIHPNHYRVAAIAVKPMNIAIENPLDNLVAPIHFQTPIVFHKKHIAVSHIAVASNTAQLASLPAPATVLSAGSPGRDHSKETCKESKTSMHTGMLSLTVTLFSLMLGLILLVVKNSGSAWATSNMISGVIFGGLISGGALGVLAVVFGIIALHKISAEADIYTGKSKAVTGIVFASILFSILTLMVV